MKRDLEWRTQPYEVPSSGCSRVLLPAVNVHVLASRCELQLRDLCAKLPTRDYKCHAVQDCAPSPLLPLLPLLAATAALFIYFQRQRWQRCPRRRRRRRRRRSCSCSRSRSHTANPKAAPVACLLSVLLLMGGHRLTITRFNRHRGSGGWGQERAWGNNKCARVFQCHHRGQPRPRRILCQLNSTIRTTLVKTIALLNYG